MKYLHVIHYIGIPLTEISLYQILFQWSNQGEWGRYGTWHAWRQKERHTGFCKGKRKERNNFEDIPINGQ